MTKTDTDVRVELVKTNKSLLSTTEVSNGCVYFVEDTKELFFDFDSKRSEVKDILVLQKEAERTSILFAPLNKFYFVLETQTLWFYKDGTWYQVSQDLTNYYTKEELNNLINKFLQYVSITYADLVALKNASELVEGTYYKITDYVTTTNGKSANTNEPSRSAGHQFDIVVRATSTSTLSELASVSLHEGDTYFATQNVGAWQIWYDINNDTTKYNWAVTDGTGKGVIYRMIDERQNDLPYDFKNIQFYRDKTLKKYACIASQMKIEDGYYYTFTTTQGTDVSKYGDMSLLTGDYTGYNTMSSYLPTSNVQVLNNNVSIQGNSRTFSGNNMGRDCYNNTFGSQIRSNNFGTFFHDNVTGDNTNYNTFQGHSQDNIFYGNIYGNTFLTNCRTNTIKITGSNYFQGNTVGEYFSNNTIENVKFMGNILGRNFSKNTISMNFLGNSTDFNISNNTFNGHTQGSTLGSWTSNNTFNYLTGCQTGIQCTNNICGYMQGVTFGAFCQHNTIGEYTVFCDIGNAVSYLKTPNGTKDSTTNVTTYGMCTTRIASGLAGASSKPIDLTGAQSTLNTRDDKFVNFDTTTKQIVVSQRTSDGYTKGVRAGGDFNWVEFTSKPQIATQDTLGEVKVDGTTIEINTDGVISAKQSGVSMSVDTWDE